jgi:hypothetical protein
VRNREINMTKFARTACLVLALSTLAACAAGSEASHHAAQGGAISEVILGFWHGLIAPFTLIGEIIQKVSPGALPWKFRFYEPSDTDVLYDVGFFVGLISGPSALSTRASRRR